MHPVSFGALVIMSSSGSKWRFSLILQLTGKEIAVLVFWCIFISAIPHSDGGSSFDANMTGMVALLRKIAPSLQVDMNVDSHVIFSILIRLSFVQALVMKSQPGSIEGRKSMISFFVLKLGFVSWNSILFSLQ